MDSDLIVGTIIAGMIAIGAAAFADSFKSDHGVPLSITAIQEVRAMNAEEQERAKAAERAAVRKAILKYRENQK